MEDVAKKFQTASKKVCSFVPMHVLMCTHIHTHTVYTTSTIQHTCKMFKIVKLISSLNQRINYNARDYIFQCPFEWFHYNCVDITAPPKGRWYCPQCTANMKRRGSRKN